MAISTWQTTISLTKWLSVEIESPTSYLSQDRIYYFSEMRSYLITTVLNFTVQDSWQVAHSENGKFGVDLKSIMMTSVTNLLNPNL